MQLNNRARSAVLLAFSLALGGCDNVLEPSAGQQTQISLSRGNVSSSGMSLMSSASFSQLLDGAVAGSDLQTTDGAFAAGKVALSNVSAIEVTITRVEALPAGGGDDDGGWVSLDVTAPAAVNLLDLPTDAEGGLTLARGDLPAGTYRNIRFFVTDATITFKESFRVGRHTYPAGEKLPLTIPGGEQAGLKTDIGFTVSDDAGADIHIVWDTDASVRRVVPTGSGKIILPPVLGARGDDDGKRDNDKGKKDTDEKGKKEKGKKGKGDKDDDGNKTEDGKTDDGKTDDGKTDDDDKTDDGKTDDGKTDDGKTDDGKTDDGKTEGGNPAGDGETENG